MAQAIADRPGVVVDYVPVLFAGFLKAHGHKGPAEIPAKRCWTYRQVLWLAARHGIDLRLPGQPFHDQAGQQSVLAQLRPGVAIKGETPI